MISFEPSQEELALQESVHRFAAERMRPALRTAEEDGIPDRLGQEFQELGVGLMALPADVGGADLGVRATAVIEEELAWGDPGIAAAFPRPGVAGYVLARLDDQRRKQWLTPLASGGAQSATTALFLGRSDGSPAFAARRQTDVLVVDGSCDEVAGADTADWTLVRVDLAGEPALVAVERGASGSTFVPDRNRLGLRTVPFGRLELKQCAVPVNAILATGLAAERALRFGLEREIGVWAAWAVGTSRAAFEYAARYATERQAFGRRIAEHQAVGFMVADMGIEVDAARGLLWHAAWALDVGGADAGRLIRSAAVYSAEVAVRVTTDAVQVLGGHGYIQDHPVEKWMRDARCIGNVIRVIEASLPAIELAAS